MIITGKEHSGPDIWPKTPNQGTGIEDIILTIWSKKAIKWKEINPQQQHPSSPSPRETHYASYTSSN